MKQEPQQPLVGMLGCDRDLFSQVWSRVSPHPGEACPIEVLPPHTPAVPAPSPAPKAAVDTLGDDEPTSSDVPCLGRAGEDHGELLQNFIRHELEDWRTYQALSTRATGQNARTLAAIGSDERRHAKRLSAALFLISGLRFLPEVPPSRPGRTPFWAMLRQRFWEEQHGAALYVAAAAETADPCLAALYRELSAEESAHADLLRAMVERM